MRKSVSLVILLMLVLSVLGAEVAFTQERSSYAFRYSPRDSGFFLEEMTFPEAESVDLGECVVNFRINGPLACALNCNQVPVCLYVFEGPAGLGVTDILEKLEEKPLSNDQ